MSGAQRLDKIYPALTARERALLVLQAWQDDTDEDRLVRSTMPAAQVTDFNRYIELMNATNQKIGVFILAVRLLVDHLSLRFGWLLTVLLLGAEVKEECRRRSRVDDLWEIHVKALRNGITKRWTELRSAEEVLNEIGQQFEVEDPTIPSLREVVESIRGDLLELREKGGPYLGDLDLPGPDEELTKQLRELADLPDSAD
ncbi:MAG: hypothetical protein Q7T33_06065 [Dehalococcoidia bacterium]|nr:hypothetical protein [Dehalococcoidia bacterium]